MTFRLVGLMSVVLLISLAASALLMNYYQEQVMTEVAQTASNVGRETLRTFEFAGDGPLRAGALPALDWRFETDEEAHVTAGAEDIKITADTIEARGEGIVVFSTSRTNRQKHVIVKEIKDGDIIERHIELLPDFTGEVALETEVDATGAEDGQTEGFMTVIRLEDVRAVEEDDQELYLTIPALRASNQAWVGAPPGGPPVDPSSGPGDLVAVREEFRLQVPTEEFDALFSSMGRKSMWIFLGVFVLGTV
ncbi:MAG: hypothetical protein R3344_11145, partial [Acidobacteriota bacterium]|nr:hypothetical protein [Acidobacteriota bacterium]